MLRKEQPKENLPSLFRSNQNDFIFVHRHRTNMPTKYDFYNL